jgi:hypothetical protein
MKKPTAVGKMIRIRVSTSDPKQRSLFIPHDRKLSVVPSGTYSQPMTMEELLWLRHQVDRAIITLSPGPQPTAKPPTRKVRL